MSLNIGSYQFEGPYTSSAQLKDNSGVYVILTNRGSGNYTVVDVGESAQVKTRIENHDRADCWEKIQRETYT